MTSRIINIVFILLVSCFAHAQTLKEKTEKLFSEEKSLIEESHEFYNTNGQITKSVTTDYTRGDENFTFKDYIYNGKAQLVKETLSGMWTYRDSLNIKQRTDTSIISITHYAYDSLGRIALEKDYNFQCDHDTCDIIRYIYEGNLLVKKQCTSDCSFKTRIFHYPVYYKYDKNDSLILEQAWGPEDTTKQWYAYSFDYSFFPEKLIAEEYYKNGDSLELKHRTVTKAEYLPDGKESRVIYLEKDLTYTSYEYYENGFLKSSLSVNEGKETWKLVYHYDKRNNITRIDTYDENTNKVSKLKLNYYQTFDYKYY